MISIAIDGPSGAGKSTLSRRIAQELGYLYVDTGALYRVVGLAALRAGAEVTSAEKIEALLPSISVSLRYIQNEQHVFLGEEDVSSAIRDEAVSMAASHVSAHPATRAFLLETQRRLARENNVLMDGRDIGSVVLPNADVKIYLTATVQDRAKRRYDQLLESGRQADYDTILKDVEQRDYNDTHRDIAPLMQVPDAVLVDTTGLSYEEGYNKLLSSVKNRLGEL